MRSRSGENGRDEVFEESDWGFGAHKRTSPVAPDSRRRKRAKRRGWCGGEGRVKRRRPALSAGRRQIDGACLVGPLLARGKRRDDLGDGEATILGLEMFFAKMLSLRPERSAVDRILLGSHEKGPCFIERSPTGPIGAALISGL